MDEEAMLRWEQAQQKLRWYRERGRQLEQKRLAEWEEKTRATAETSTFMETRRKQAQELRESKESIKRERARRIAERDREARERRVELERFILAQV